MSNSCSHRHTRRASYDTSATGQRYRASEKENGSKKVFIKHHTIQFHSVALKPALAPWKQESWINLWRWGSTSGVQVKFITNIIKYHFHSQKKFEVREKKQRQQQPTKYPWNVLCKVFQTGKPTKAKTWAWSSGFLHSSIKNNNGKYNLVSVCTIKTTL